MLMYQTRPSNSARTLRDALDIRKIDDTRSPLNIRRLRRHSLLMNWGNSRAAAHLVDHRWLNRPEAVAVAVSKFQTLTKLHEEGVDAVEVTRDDQLAQTWDREGRCLTRRDGLSGGQGIRHQFWAIADNEHFYAKVFPKTHEFRVHVFNGKAIDFTEKKARSGADVNRLIRSHDNGWIFAHENLSVTKEDRDELEDIAISAIEAIGLDFGAVDLLGILNKKTPRRLKKAVVCEINTAPGLENTATITAYVNAVKEVQND